MTANDDRPLPMHDGRPRVASPRTGSGDGRVVRRTSTGAAIVAMLVAAPSAPVRAQNDWQFPDPHFGAVEFGPGVPGPRTEREYRAVVDPAIRTAAPGYRRRVAPAAEVRPRFVRPPRPRGRLRAVD